MFEESLMRKWGLFILITLAVALAITWLVANTVYRAQMAEAEGAWADIAAQARPATQTFDPQDIADLPEIAQRYFIHAIAPGTVLATHVELKMAGQFFLGNKEEFQSFEMEARQILAAPEQFVWIACMHSGLMKICGSDGLYQSKGWTRFWMFQALPIVQGAANEDVDRAALARPALETVWAPATLLPANGAKWEQIGPDQARITVGSGENQTEIILTIAENGRPVEMVTQRWNDTNPSKTYQFQPFGGTMEAEATFGGFTIPSHVRVGHHFGTPEYFAFFDAKITTARFY
jgi:hypothetical protein